MKKKFVVFTMILAVGLSSAFVYAESPKTNRFQIGSKLELNELDQDKWFEERAEFRRKSLEDAVKDGLVSEKEAKRWQEHFDYMDEFHRENGYGGCYGRGTGRGMGMMNGFRGYSRFAR